MSKKKEIYLVKKIPFNENNVECFYRAVLSEMEFNKPLGKSVFTFHKAKTILPDLDEAQGVWSRILMELELKDFRLK